MNPVHPPVGSTSATAPPELPRNRMLLFTITGLAAVALLLVSLLAFQRYAISDQAQTFAKQLSSKLTAAGLTPPSEKQIARTLGDDGGPMCASPGNALSTAQQAALSTGAAGPGIRPVIAARRVVEGAGIAISVYCPDKLPAFTEYVNGLKTADVSYTD